MENDTVVRSNKIDVAWGGLQVKSAYEYACNKHPVFPKNPHAALSILVEEVGEMAEALNEGDMAGALFEAAQVGAVIQRFLEEFS